MSDARAVTVAGTSPCLLCPGDTHPFHYDRAGSYIIQCPKLAEDEDRERIVQVLPVYAHHVALTASGRLYKLTFTGDTRVALTPIVLSWLQVARPV